MQGVAPRRFYKSVNTEKGSAGWCVALDGKILRSPGKNAFELPGRALAQAIAAEWDAQVEQVKPTTMPLMQLAATAIDRVAGERDKIVAELAGYAATDLVCYRAAEPEALVAREAQAWDPLLDWLRRRYDVSLLTTSGIVHVAQPQATMEALTRVVAGYDDFTLAALATAVHAAGSLVIGLALAEGEITPEQAAHAAQVDELYQAEHWGEDSEAVDRRIGQLADLVAARRLLDLLDRD